MPKAPARIHVILSRDSQTAVVIRRGPAKVSCVVGWNRATDKFSVGQWLKGRIYERRSDISPDGKYFIYFAMNGKWNSETRGSWTAISKAPFLKAVNLYGKGDCWHGGGLFTGRNQFWLNDGYGHEIISESQGLCRDTKHAPTENYGGECLSVYYPRLLRDGWQLMKFEKDAATSIFEKPMPHGWILRKFAHADPAHPEGKGCYWDEHELECTASGMVIKCPDWEWSDLDGTRLVWAEKGQIWCGDLSSGELAYKRVLHDFNHMIFEPLEAPY